MPGVCGYVKKDNDGRNVAKMVESMMRQPSRLVSAPVWENDDIVISGNMLAFAAYLRFETDVSVVYVVGRCYNQGYLCGRFDFLQATHSFPQMLCIAYERELLYEVLHEIDGVYHAVIYDKVRKRLILFADRHGLSLLYWYKNKDDFVFGAEVKSILALPGIDKEWDEESFEPFLDLNFFLGEKTWFKKIHLLKPSMVLEYDLASREMIQKRYWAWSDIKQKNISFDDAVNMLVPLMKQCMKGKICNGDKFRVPLSGGLDSRMCVAALFRIVPYSSTCYMTFGTRGCPDIPIAKFLIEQIGAKDRYKIYYFTDKSDPLSDRAECVWIQDGLFTIADSHGYEFQSDDMDSTCLIDGFAGDAILGGSLMHDITLLDERISLEGASSYCGSHVVKTDFYDSYYETPHYEPFILDNRVRRFTVYGGLPSLDFRDVICPFAGNEIMDFVYSIPDKYRYRNKLYRAALLKAFPEFYYNIPWEKKGLPLSFQLGKNFLAGLRMILEIKVWRRRVRSLLWRITKISKFLVKHTPTYFNYCAYVKRDDVQMRIKNLLLRHMEYVHQYKYLECIQKYIEKNYDKIRFEYPKILRLATAKMYLDRVYFGDKGI